mgnify:CR=1 FL=1
MCRPDDGFLQGHLDLRARREGAELSVVDTGGAALAAGRARLEKGRRRQLATAVGPETVTRCARRPRAFFGPVAHKPARTGPGFRRIRGVRRSHLSVPLRC